MENIVGTWALIKTKAVDAKERQPKPLHLEEQTLLAELSLQKKAVCRQP